MSIFSKYKKHSFGIAITDDAIRFITLKRNKRTGINIEVFNEVFLKKGIVVDGEIVKATELAQILSSLNKNKKNIDVHVIIPEQLSFRSFLKNIEIDDKDKSFSEFINEFVKKEHNINLKKEEFICEYETTELENGNYNVYISCVPKILISSYEFIFEQSGFNLKSFETYTENIARIMFQKEKNQACLTIEFGKEKSWVTLLNQGFPVQQICVPIGGNHLVNPIQEFLNIEKKDAILIKEKYGISRSHKEERLLQKLLGKLTPIINSVNKQYIYWHSQEYKNKPYDLKINEILLYGEESNLSGLQDHISKSLRLPVRQIDLVKDSDHLFQEILNLHRDDWYKYFPAVFAALSEFKK